MKTLLLMRHAKSSRDDPALADHERPLNDRGRRDAPMMGARLAGAGLAPDAIVSSDALRARQTAEAAAAACGYRKDIRYLAALYAAEPATYLAALRELPDDTNTVLAVGHNPEIEGLIQLLAGREVTMPTAAIAHLDLPVERWGGLTSSTSARLIELLRPKDEE